MTNGIPCVLTPAHPDYPIEVRSMSRPPSKLYLLGALPQGRKVAIVGTRRASAAALSFTRGLAARLCADGWSVWSGGAAGIDSAVHEGALEADGNTVVVMGTGFDHLYPVDNANLFARVLESQGAWLSLYPPEQVGTRWSFIARNELLAAMVDHVVVVQAPVRSGARSTMAAARRMGKITWAVPGSPWDTTSEGCLLEIAAGARPLAYPEQMLGMKSRPPRSLPSDLSRNEQAVADVVAQLPSYLDSLCEQTGLSVADASAAVLSLTLRQVLLESADGRYFLNDRHRTKKAR